MTKQASVKELMEDSRKRMAARKPIECTPQQYSQQQQQSNESTLRYIERTEPSSRVMKRFYNI